MREFECVAGFRDGKEILRTVSAVAAAGGGGWGGSIVENRGPGRR
jgi:hypothetical protein